MASAVLPAPASVNADASTDPEALEVAPSHTSSVTINATAPAASEPGSHLDGSERSVAAASEKSTGPGADGATGRPNTAQSAASMSVSDDAAYSTRTLVKPKPVSTVPSDVSEGDDSSDTGGCWRDPANRVKTYLFFGTIVVVWLFVNGTLAEQGRVGVRTGNMTDADAGIAASREHWGWRVLMGNIEFAMSPPIFWSIVYLIHKSWVPLRWFIITALVTCGLQMVVHSFALRYGPVTVYDQQYWSPIENTDTLDVGAYWDWVRIDFWFAYSLRQWAPPLLIWWWMRKTPEGRARNKRAGRVRCDEVFWMAYIIIIPAFAVLSQFGNNPATGYSVWINVLLTPLLGFLYKHYKKGNPPPSLPYLMLIVNYVESKPHAIAGFFRLQTAAGAVLWLAAYELLAFIIYHGWRYAALMATGDDEKKADLVLFQFRTFHLMLSEVIFLSVDPLGVSFFLMVLIEDVYLFFTFSGLGRELWQMLCQWKVGFVSMTEKELRLLAVDADQNLFGEMLAIVVVVAGILAERLTVSLSDGEFRPLLSKAAGSDFELGLLLLGYVVVAASQAMASVGVRWVLTLRDLKLQRENTEEAAKLAAELKLIVPPVAPSRRLNRNASGPGLAHVSPSVRLQQALASPSRRVAPATAGAAAAADVEAGEGGGAKLARNTSMFAKMSRSKREIVTKSMVVNSSRATTKAIQELWVKHPLLVTSVTMFTAMKSLRLVMMIAAKDGSTLFERAM